MVGSLHPVQVWLYSDSDWHPPMGVEYRAQSNLTRLWRQKNEQNLISSYDNRFMLYYWAIKSEGTCITALDRVHLEVL